MYVAGLKAEPLLVVDVSAVVLELSEMIGGLDDEEEESGLSRDGERACFNFAPKPCLFALLEEERCDRAEVAVGVGTVVDAELNALLLLLAVLKAVEELVVEVAD